MRGGGTCLNAPASYPEGVNQYPQGILSRTLVYDTSKKFGLFIKSKAGLLRLKHLTRSRLTALHSLAGLQAYSSLSSLAPCNDAYAFTLAEVLVTLGIIGVVSAMTVPSLMQNHQRQTYAVSAHKVYNELQQALTQYLTDNNSVGINETGLTNADLDTSVSPFLKKYFKVINDCKDKTTPCFANEYKSLSGTVITAGRGQPARCVTIASGASMCMGSFSGDADSGTGYIYVDTNGPKGPNIGCRDYWRMFYFSDASVDGYKLSPGCKKDGTKCPNGGTLQAQREFDWTAGCGDPSDPSDVDGIGRLIGSGWVMDW